MARTGRTRAGRASAALLGALALAAATLTGCAPQETGVTVALLLPESKTARYEALDRPFFTERLTELGDYRVL
jgi:D-xylose transport system substrate-binding protein